MKFRRIAPMFQVTGTRERERERERERDRERERERKKEREREREEEREREKSKEKEKRERNKEKKEETERPYLVPESTPQSLQKDTKALKSTLYVCCFVLCEVLDAVCCFIAA
jgi:hypothetical protein